MRAQLPPAPGDLMDCRLLGSSVFLQGMFPGEHSFSGVCSHPRDQTPVSCIAGRFFITEPFPETLDCLLKTEQWKMKTDAWKDGNPAQGTGSAYLKTVTEHPSDVSLLRIVTPRSGYLRKNQAFFQASQVTQW